MALGPAQALLSVGREAPDPNRPSPGLLNPRGAGWDLRLGGRNVQGAELPREWGEPSFGARSRAEKRVPAWICGAGWATAPCPPHVLWGTSFLLALGAGNFVGWAPAALWGGSSTGEVSCTRRWWLQLGMSPRHEGQCHELEVPRVQMGQHAARGQQAPGREGTPRSPREHPSARHLPRWPCRRGGDRASATLSPL